MPITAVPSDSIHLNYERSSGPKFTVPESVSDCGVYALGPEIGRGAMGVVYQARHREMGRTVAMKIMRGAGFSDSDEIGRFRAETEAAARLDHPNIVPVYEVGEIFGQPFFTMKLIEGGSLNERLQQGKVPARDAARLVAKIASAVHHAHERGVLHRDIKPGNILLTPPAPNAELGEPFLTDFGLAKFAGVDQALTCPGDLIGTPDYIAPEQARGSRDLTIACDVWALGVLLYQMISGELPFNAPTPLTILDRVKNDEPKPLECDRDLATIIARCLDKEPAQRMPTAGFLVEELERWLKDEPIRSRHITPAERIWKWVRRNPWRVGVALTLMSTVMAGSITSVVLWQKAQKANFELNAANSFALSANESLSRANDQLAKSLRISTANRLATDSRSQIRENAQLGLLLAVESAEMTMGVDRSVLPESLGALYYATQNVGGTDATASRGSIDTDRVFSSQTATAAYMQESPDGRWFVTVDFCEQGEYVALFDNTLPLVEQPRRRWLLNGNHTTDVACFDVCWSPDSREIVTLDHDHDTLRKWALLDKIDPDHRVPTITETPPVKEFGPIRSPKATRRYEAHFICNASGTPIAIGTIESAPNAMSVGKGANIYPAWWIPLDISADQPLGQILEIPAEPADQTSLRDRLRGSKSVNWVLNYNAYNRDTPHVFRVSNPAAAPRRIPLEPISSVIVSFAFSDDEHWLVLSLTDGKVRLHNLRADTDEAISKGRIINSDVHVYNDLKFSPDGHSLLMVGGDALCKLVPFDDGGPQMDQQVQFRPSANETGHCTFSRDGKWLAICGDNRVVTVWPTSQVSQAVRPIEFRGLPTSPIRVEFSQDGKILSALAWGGTCRRWEFDPARPGVLPLTAPRDHHVIKSIAASPDGRWIAASGYPSSSDKSGFVAPIFLHDTTKNLAAVQLPGHVRATDVKFSADGHWLATVGRDSLVHVWDMPAVVAAFEAHAALPEPLKLIPTYQTRETYNRALAFHPAGWLYCTCGDGRIFWWDLNSSDPAATYRDRDIHSILYILSDIAFSPDGQWLAVARHGADFAPREGSTQFGNMVLLFDSTDPYNPKPRAELPGNFREEGVVAFSADSRWLAGGAQQSSPCVWDLAAPDIAASRRVAPCNGNLIRGVAFPPATQNPTGTPMLAFGNADGHLHLWDWQRGGNTICNIETSERIFALAYLPDGRIATGNGDARVRIWDTDPSRLIEIARRTAGRELTESERAPYIPRQLIK